VLVAGNDIASALKAALVPDTGLSDRLDDQNQRLSDLEASQSLRFTQLEASQQSIVGQLQAMTALLQSIVPKP
jgi:transcriptional regulator with GAF, ATPase, and Fis domain